MLRSQRGVEVMSIEGSSCRLTGVDILCIIVCKLTNLHMEVVKLLDEMVVNVQSECSLLVDETIEYDFGSYLRAVRRARKLSVRQLAKAVGKTPTCDHASRSASPWCRYPASDPLRWRPESARNTEAGCRD